METVRSDEIRSVVRENYGKLAESTIAGGCCCSGSTCCGVLKDVSAAKISRALGYSDADMTGLPEGANMGLGCGNPQAIANLKPGETVLDLGSGGGFDCFLAARAVGESGHVIGVDMTPAMISKARRNAAEIGFRQVEFRLGELENLPVADRIVDVILSNCVINLSPEKQRVFDEAYRVLKPGGRLAISDVVQTAEMPEVVRKDMALYSACIAGASAVSDLESMLKKTGFQNIRIQPKPESRNFIKDWAPGSRVEDCVVSATIEAVKP